MTAKIVAGKNEQHVFCYYLDVTKMKPKRCTALNAIQLRMVLYFLTPIPVCHQLWVCQSLKATLLTLFFKQIQAISLALRTSNTVC